MSKYIGSFLDEHLVSRESSDGSVELVEVGNHLHVFPLGSGCVKSDTLSIHLPIHCIRRLFKALPDRLNFIILKSNCAMRFLVLLNLPQSLLSFKLGLFLEFDEIVREDTSFDSLLFLLYILFQLSLFLGILNFLVYFVDAFHVALYEIFGVGFQLFFDLFLFFFLVLISNCILKLFSLNLRLDILKLLQLKRLFYKIKINKFKNYFKYNNKSHLRFISS